MFKAMESNTIQEKVERYLSNLQPNGNEHSWRFCHKAFHPSSGKDADYLALQLAAYLASWGMYRGSSGLFRTNYTVHAGAVDIILEFRSKLYMQNEDDLFTLSQIEQMMQLKELLKSHYKGIQVNWSDKGLKSISPTDTLLSKIILGSLGCVPAYDTYFIIGVKGHQNAKISPEFSMKSVIEVNEFIRLNEEEFNVLQKKYQDYTLMKLTDMYFFQSGYDLESKQKSSSPPLSPALR